MPTLELEVEWLKQANVLAELFARILGKSGDEYRDSLPRFVPQPESYRGRLNTQVIVQVPQRRLTLRRMLAAQEVAASRSDIKGLRHWHKDPQVFRTPDTPYTTYLDDGSRNLNRTLREVRASLKSDERGGTPFDGLALLVQNPDILRRHNLALSGFQLGPGKVPALFR